MFNEKKVITIIITALCISACGNIASVSSDNRGIGLYVVGNAMSASDISDVDGAAGESGEGSAENKKSPLSEKYADIYDCLENSDYDQAVDIVRAMKPEALYENLYNCLEMKIMIRRYLSLRR